MASGRVDTGHYIVVKGSLYYRRSIGTSVYEDL
jgi:hypothetical protein